MAYELKIEEKPGYLQFSVRGRNSQQNVMRYMEEVMRECAARRCTRVLIVENLDGPRLGTMEVFTMVTAGSKRYHGMFEALAYVDLNAEGGVMRFAEDVAVNRAIPVRVFRTVDGAETWLLARNKGKGAAADADAAEAAAQKPAP